MNNEANKSIGKAWFMVTPGSTWCFLCVVFITTNIKGMYV